MYFKPSPILASIFFDCRFHFGSQIKVQKIRFFRIFFQDPRCAEAAPKGLQELILSDFGLHCGRSLWSFLVEFSQIFCWHVWASGLAYVPLHVLLYFTYLLGLGGIFLGSSIVSYGGLHCAGTLQCSMGFRNCRRVQCGTVRNSGEKRRATDGSVHVPGSC